MAEPYTGQVSPFAFPFAPANWAFCNGGTVPLNQYSALFSLIGFSFGGDGRSSFGLPNLNGAAPCGSGQGPGLTNRQLGQSFGTAAVTLDQTTMAPHNHGFTAVPVGRGAQATSVPLPTSGLAANGATAGPYGNGSPNATMSPNAIVANGGGGSHNNMQPFLTVNYCIALLGMYPEFN